MRHFAESGLSEIDRRVARIVSRQPTIANKALGAAAGVSEERACRIKRKPEVQAAIARLGVSSVDGKRDEVRIGASIGLDTLIGLAQDSQNEWVKLRAAQVLVNLGVKVSAQAVASQAGEVVDEITIRHRIKAALGISGQLIPRVEQPEAALRQ